MSTAGTEESPDASNPYRTIPQVEKLLENPRVAGWCAALSRPLVARLVSDILLTVREGIHDTGSAPDEPRLLEAIESQCRSLSSKRIRKVINGTGIILHTNMGRAPLPLSVWRETEGANTGYSNLELDLQTGKRGNRNGICPELIGMLTGGEDAMVVNNNAAGVFLVLAAFAHGKEVIVSRGEQVQIGGGFRIPDILALSGARLVEVGTTNITTLADYTGAITADTALVLLVHSSNFRIRGFTEKPELSELAARIPPHVILAVDQGSGTTTESIAGETRVRSYVKRGAHLVCFSADKVLGGPQAGIIAGRKDLVHALSSHPLARAFRPGKTVYSLLEVHLVRRLNGTEPGHAERVLSIPLKDLRLLGGRILRGIPKIKAAVVASSISTGGGSAPDEFHPSLSIELAPLRKPEEMLESLRALEIPIIGVIEGDRVRLSLATMFGEDERYIAASIRTIVGG